MRGADALSNVLRFFLLLFLQVFLFRQVSLGFGGKDYLFIFLLPLFIALMPLRTPRPLVVIYGFLMGICVDFFYETLGLHAAAATFCGYIRQFILRALEPKDGYKVKSSPDGRDLSNSWWATYLFYVATAYCIFYFSVEAFAPAFWKDILLKSLFSIPMTWILCYILVTFLRPRI
ncbi:MAG: rod shape-determining protein MreD [Bacteroidota bacterium]